LFQQNTVSSILLYPTHYCFQQNTVSTPAFDIYIVVQLSLVIMLWSYHTVLGIAHFFKSFMWYWSSCFNWLFQE
jgi:hypothetical protein